MGESPPGRSQLADIHIATLRGKNTIPRHTIFPPFCRLRTLAQARPHDDDHLSSNEQITCRSHARALVANDGDGASFGSS